MIGTESDFNSESVNYYNSTGIGYGTRVTASNEVRLGNNEVETLFCMGATAPTTSEPNMYVDPVTGQIMRCAAPPKSPVTVNDPGQTIEGQAAITVTFTVPQARKGKTVYISPDGELPDGIVMAYARVKTDGVVETKFTNITGQRISVPAMQYFISVIQ